MPELNLGTATIATSRGINLDALAPPESEKDFQSRVVSLARSLGWMVFHPFDSRRSEPGWPDLSLVRERFIVAELKAENGKLTEDQERWLEAFRRARVPAYCWRPSDWVIIEKALA